MTTSPKARRVETPGCLFKPRPLLLPRHIDASLVTYNDLAFEIYVQDMARAKTFYIDLHSLVRHLISS